VRIGRVLCEENETIKALQLGESDKSVFNIENDWIGALLTSLLKAKGTFDGTAGQLREELCSVDHSLRSSTRSLALRISKLWPHLEKMFKATKTVGHANVTFYKFELQKENVDKCKEKIVDEPVDDNEDNGIDS
jgi:hypothetical protein